MSSLIQMDLLSISRGQLASPALTQAYTARGFSRVIRQKGYLMITGVLLPTPSSQNRTRRP